ncbi:hypothetical protein CBR_g24300 [Chara braunii]|uniref:R3H domain-containing protein n=1 Tax=Chara braunii TaxID=69332 RepID=A0A388JMA8_CHABU|nr:hypothetical protein CBR_g24300 [Chara braunii]|eukprot:GBG58949.1 hypothetical protein CBR_g24300 [Chara braunii]
MPTSMIGLSISEQSGGGDVAEAARQVCSSPAIRRGGGRGTRSRSDGGGTNSVLSPKPVVQQVWKEKRPSVDGGCNPGSVGTTGTEAPTPTSSTLTSPLTRGSGSGSGCADLPLPGVSTFTATAVAVSATAVPVSRPLDFKLTDGARSEGGEAATGGGGGGGGRCGGAIFSSEASMTKSRECPNYERSVVSGISSNVVGARNDGEKSASVSVVTSSGGSISGKRDSGAPAERGIAESVAIAGAAAGGGNQGSEAGTADTTSVAAGMVALGGFSDSAVLSRPASRSAAGAVSGNDAGGLTTDGSQAASAGGMGVSVRAMEDRTQCPSNSASAVGAGKGFNGVGEDKKINGGEGGVTVPVKLSVSVIKDPGGKYAWRARNSPTTPDNRGGGGGGVVGGGVMGEGVRREQDEPAPTPRRLSEVQSSGGGESEVIPSDRGPILPSPRKADGSDRGVGGGGWNGSGRVVGREEAIPAPLFVPQPVPGTSLVQVGNIWNKKTNVRGHRRSVSTSAVDLQVVLPRGPNERAERHERGGIRRQFPPQPPSLINGGFRDPLAQQQQNVPVGMQQGGVGGAGLNAPAAANGGPAPLNGAMGGGLGENGVNSVSTNVRVQQQRQQPGANARHVRSATWDGQNSRSGESSGGGSIRRVDPDHTHSEWRRGRNPAEVDGQLMAMDRLEGIGGGGGIPLPLQAHLGTSIPSPLPQQRGHYRRMSWSQESRHPQHQQQQLMMGMVPEHRDGHDATMHLRQDKERGMVMPAPEQDRQSEQRDGSRQSGVVTQLLQQQQQQQQQTQLALQQQQLLAHQKHQQQLTHHHQQQQLAHQQQQQLAHQQQQQLAHQQQHQPQQWYGNSSGYGGREVGEKMGRTEDRGDDSGWEGHHQNLQAAGDDGLTGGGRAHAPSPALRGREGGDAMGNRVSGGSMGGADVVNNVERIHRRSRSSGGFAVEEQQMGVETGEAGTPSSKSRSEYERMKRETGDRSRDGSGYDGPQDEDEKGSGDRINGRNKEKVKEGEAEVERYQQQLQQVPPWVTRGGAPSVAAASAGAGRGNSTVQTRRGRARSDSFDWGGARHRSDMSSNWRSGGPRDGEESAGHHQFFHGDEKDWSSERERVRDRGEERLDRDEWLAMERVERREREDPQIPRRVEREDKQQRWVGMGENSDRERDPPPPPPERRSGGGSIRRKEPSSLSAIPPVSPVVGGPVGASPRPSRLMFGRAVPQLVQELEEKLMKGQVECMICCEIVGRSSSVWSCSSCYAIFHLSCTRKWARVPVATASDLSAAGGQQQPGGSGEGTWRCPGCQTPQSIRASELRYRCFCGQREDPPNDPYLTPHSCGDACRKPLARPTSDGGYRCPHVCTMRCHPGPHAPCAAMAPTVFCYCRKSEITRKCADYEKHGRSCGSTCMRSLACGRHTCPRVCHEGACGVCEVTVKTRCFCGKKEELQSCGRIEFKGEFPTSGGVFSCMERCSKILGCGNHRCERFCHPGPCGDCRLLPSLLLRCPCGKEEIKNLLGGMDRKGCLDPVPTCEGVCEKLLACGKHRCEQTCHNGACPPCEVPMEQKCRCVLAVRIVPCFQLDVGTVFTCDRKCGKLKNCRRHRCSAVCCAAPPVDSPGPTAPVPGDSHFCMIVCGKKLRCGRHTCQELCHPGHCPPCMDSVMTELECACGRTSIPPPVPCGTPLPACPFPCSVPQPCGHPSTHLCHFGDCPPCTVAVAKECVGGHVVLRGVPCGSKDIRCNAVCGKLRRCGIHTCTRTCHRPPCDAVEIEGEGDHTSPGSRDGFSISRSSRRLPCGQTCGQPRRDCEHFCKAVCHPGEACPNSRCTAVVAIVCLCGRLKAQVQCCAGGGDDDDGFDEAAFVSQLGLKLQPVQQSADGASPGYVPLGRRKIACDDECAKCEKKRILANAFGVSMAPGLEGEEGTAGGTESGAMLMEMIRRDPIWVSAVELRLQFLLLGSRNALKMSTASATSGMRVHVFRYLPKERRAAIHELAARWLMESISVGWEPKRFIVVYTTAKSRAPLRGLISKPGSSVPAVGHAVAPLPNGEVDMDPRCVISFFDLPRDADISAGILRFAGDCELVWLNDRNALSVFSNPIRATTALRYLDHASAYWGAIAQQSQPSQSSSAGASTGMRVWGKGPSVQASSSSSSGQPAHGSLAMRRNRSGSGASAAWHADAWSENETQADLEGISGGSRADPLTQVWKQEQSGLAQSNFWSALAEEGDGDATEENGEGSTAATPRTEGGDGQRGSHSRSDSGESSKKGASGLNAAGTVPSSPSGGGSPLSTSSVIIRNVGDDNKWGAGGLALAGLGDGCGKGDDEEDWESVLDDH